jgi:hypothetical protein
VVNVEVSDYTDPLLNVEERYFFKDQYGPLGEKLRYQRPQATPNAQHPPQMLYPVQSEPWYNNLGFKMQHSVVGSNRLRQEIEHERWAATQPRVMGVGRAAKIILGHFGYRANMPPPYYLAQTPDDLEWALDMLEVQPSCFFSLDTEMYTNPRKRSECTSFMDQHPSHREKFGLHPHRFDGPWTVLIQITGVKYWTVVIDVRGCCRGQGVHPESGLPVATLSPRLRQFLACKRFFTLAGDCDQRALDGTFQDPPRLRRIELQRELRDIDLGNALGMKAAVAWATTGCPSPLPDWLARIPDPIAKLKGVGKGRNRVGGYPSKIPVLFLDLNEALLDYSATDALWTMYTAQVLCMTQAPVTALAEFERDMRRLVALPQVAVDYWPAPSHRIDEFMQVQRELANERATIAHAQCSDTAHHLWTLGWAEELNETHLDFMRQVISLGKHDRLRWSPEEILFASLSFVKTFAARWGLKEPRAVHDGIQGRWFRKDGMGIPDSKPQLPTGGLRVGWWPEHIRKQQVKANARAAAKAAIEAQLAQGVSPADLLPEAPSSTPVPICVAQEISRSIPGIDQILESSMPIEALDL